jgi:hypothetical protein
VTLTISGIGAVTNIARGLELSGITAPAELAEATRRATQHIATIEAISPKQGELPSAILKALDAGQDPAADPETQRLVIAMNLASVASNVREQVQSDSIDTLRFLVPDILQLLSDAMDEAVADMQDALKVLGDIDLSEHEAVLAQGGSIASAWVKANVANQRAGHIITAWHTLVSSAGLRNPGQTPLVYLEPTYEEFTDKEQALPASVWDAIRRDITVKMSGRDDWATRRQAIDAEHDRREEASNPRRRPF